MSIKTECAAVQYMKRVVAEEAARSTKNEDCIFTSVLNVIADMREYEMTAMDIEVLHMLIEFITKEGHESLLPLIRADAPGCEICAALTARMDIKRARGA